MSRPPAWLLPSGSGPTRPCPLSQASACSPARPTRTRPGSFPPELWPIKVERLVGAGSVSACCVRHPHKLGDTQGFVLCLHLVFYYRQAWWAVRKVEVRAELRCAVMRLRPHRWRCQDAQTALCRGSGSWCTSDPGAGTPLSRHVLNRLTLGPVVHSECLTLRPSVSASAPRGPVALQVAGLPSPRTRVSEPHSTASFCVPEAAPVGFAFYAEMAVTRKLSFRALSLRMCNSSRF